MSDEQERLSPLEVATKIEETVKAIMRHVVEPAMMDRVDAMLPEIVAHGLDAMLEPTVRERMAEMGRENAMLRDIVAHTFRSEDLDGLCFWLGTNLELTADQLALIRRIVGLDT